MMEASQRVVASYKLIIPTFGSVRLEVDPEDYSLSPSKLPPPPSLEKPIASAVDFIEKGRPSKAWLIASIFMLQIFFMSFDLWAVLALNESRGAKAAWIVAWFLSAIGINAVCVGIYHVKVHELEYPLRAHLKSLSKPGRTLHLRIMRQKHYLKDCASCGYYSPTSIRSRWEAFFVYRMERWFVDVLENEGEAYVPISMMVKPTLNAGEEAEEAAAKAG